MSRIADLKPDGSTSSGCWIYAGVFSNGENLSKRRDFKTDPGNLGLYPGFGWTWPNNMRVLYNRASCDRHGKPYPGSKPIVWWDEAAGKWAGHDVPDVPMLTDGPDTPNGQRAFHMNAEGVGRLFAAVYKDPDLEPRTSEHFPRDASYVPKDGPLPEMYEPVESPVENCCTRTVKSNPLLKYPARANRTSRSARSRTSRYVLMTSTVAEHWCAGSTTRNIPWLNELVPEPMVEMPQVSLAQKLSVKTGDWVTVSSSRGEVEVKAMVTPGCRRCRSGAARSRSCGCRTTGASQGLSTGASVNHITIDAVDPGAGTQETKACLVNIVKVRTAIPSSPVPGGRRHDVATTAIATGAISRRRRWSTSPSASAAAPARWRASSGTIATAKRPSSRTRWASRTRRCSARRR